MRLDVVKNVSLGALLLILLLVSSVAIFNIRGLSNELTRVTEVHLPVREKLMRSKELLLTINIVFNEFKSYDHAADEDILTFLHKLQANIEQLVPESHPDSTKILILSSLHHSLELLQSILQEKEKHDLAGTKDTQYDVLTEELQKEISNVRNYLHLLLENPIHHDFVASQPDLLFATSRLLNLLEIEVNRYLASNYISIHEVTAPLDSCLSIIRELSNISQVLGFNLEHQKQIENLIIALETYKSAVILYDDEIKLDVSGSNLDEISLLVENAQQESSRIFELLNNKLIQLIDGIQNQAIYSLKQLQSFFILFSALSICLALILSFWFSHFLTNRFDRLIEGAERIGQGQLDFRFNELPKQNDQFGLLATVVNNMAAALQHRELSLTQNIDTIAKSQKLEAVGSLAGGIAHDFNNILTAIMGYADLIMLKISGSDSDLKEDISVIQTSSRRAKNLISQLLSFSKESENRMLPLELTPLVKETTKLLKGTSPSIIEISDHSSSSCTVMADPSQIHQVLTNIGTNAIQSMEIEGGKLEIKLKEVEISTSEAVAYENIQAGRYALISISDTGPGIAPEYIDRIYDPYFTTKEFGKGTGLGLFVVYGITKKHGGTINVTSSQGHGTTFDILLPIIHADPPEISGENPSEDDLPRGHEKILVVDDEKYIRELGKRILEEFGYTVKTAENGKMALDLLKQDSAFFDMVITDQTMPKMTGFELVENIQKINPSLPIIMITGYSEHVSRDKAIKAGVRQYILKPFDKEILTTIRTVFDEV